MMGSYKNCGKQVLHMEGDNTTHIADARDDEAAHFLVTMANAPKDENGGPVVPFNFVEQALVTLSPDFHASRVARHVFVAALNSAIAALTQLDKVKKSLYYGRDNNLISNGQTDCAGLLMSIVRAEQCNNASGLNEKQAADLIHGCLGLATEAGEMLELLKRAVNGHGVDLVNIKEESGDSKWYLAILSRVAGFMWGDDERSIIAKLRHRFADRFAAHDANNRDLSGEREILER